MQRTFAYSIEQATQNKKTSQACDIELFMPRDNERFALFSWLNRLQLYNNLICMFKAVRFSFSLRFAWSALWPKSQLSNKSENLTGFIAD